MKGSFEKLPLYFQLAENITEKIDQGIWQIGDCIPSERELSAMYNMSRITVRRAIDELEKMGKLEKVQGKGTFVRNQAYVQSLNSVYSFSAEMEKQGKISSTLLIDRQVIQANHSIAKELQIEAGQAVIYLERLRCGPQQEPLMYEKTYFDASKYGFVMDIDLDNKPLYKTLEQEYGIQIDRALERFKACELMRKESQLLNCPPRQYGLLVRRTSFSKDSLVCFSSLVSKADTFEFTVQLGRV